MKRNGLLYLSVLGQLLILGGMIGLGLRPLLTGVPVELRVQARDPRDIFRGDYVVLNYSFNQLHLATIPYHLDSSRTFRYGDHLWVELAQQGRFHEPVKVYDYLPEATEGLFLKTTVQHPFRLGGGGDPGWLELEGGIESYFTDSGQAKYLEQQLTAAPVADSAALVVASVMVAPGGEARIREVRLEKARR